MSTTKQIYTVHVNGLCRYHGVNPADALETIIAASETEGDIQVQRNAQVVNTSVVDSIRHLLGVN